eukprot:5319924-Prymnesium_polylepis.1
MRVGCWGEGVRAGRVRGGDSVFAGRRAKERWFAASRKKICGEGVFVIIRNWGLGVEMVGGWCGGRVEK